MAEVILVGREQTPVDDLADRLLEGCLSALGEFSTDDLLAIADRRAEIHAGGWMEKMVREYVEVWR